MSTETLEEFVAGCRRRPGRVFYEVARKVILVAGQRSLVLAAAHEEGNRVFTLIVPLEEGPSLSRGWPHLASLDLPLLPPMTPTAAPAVPWGWRKVYFGERAWTNRQLTYQNDQVLSWLTQAIAALANGEVNLQERKEERKA